jgi:hypothetical protein
MPIILAFSHNKAHLQATSKPPVPIASIPIPPPAGVWLSEPRVFCRSAKTFHVYHVANPFPGLLNQNPKRAAADCKKDDHPYFL